MCIKATLINVQLGRKYGYTYEYNYARQLVKPRATRQLGTILWFPRKAILLATTGTERRTRSADLHACVQRLRTKAHMILRGEKLALSLTSSPFSPNPPQPLMISDDVNAAERR